jgi:ADP-heptose:LPS heptosyltransferase
VDLLGGNPAVTNAIPLGSKLTRLHGIRREKFDAVINLHGGPTSALLTKLSGASIRVGLANFRSLSPYNVVVPRAQDIFVGAGQGEAVFHTAEHIASVFCWLGVPFRVVPAAQLFPSAHASAAVAVRLAALGFEPDERYAVIHATALYASKRWSAKGFAEMASYLQLRYGTRSISLGGRDDTTHLNEVEREMGEPLVRAVDWPTAEMVALIARSALFVGNDSGPAHAAAALGIPVAVIFGSSNSKVWGPWRARSATVQNHFDCNPCAGNHCYAYSEPRCILSIETAQVCAAVDSLIGGNSTAERGESS